MFVSCTTAAYLSPISLPLPPTIRLPAMQQPQESQASKLQVALVVSFYMVAALVVSDLAKPYSLPEALTMITDGLRVSIARLY